MVCVFLTFFLAALGACIGSFLNVVIYRLPRGMSISQPRRSFCPSCGRQIEWYDNIPILGWILLRGRCRFCRQPISLQYPLVEATAVVATIVVWHAARGYCADMPLDSCWPMVVGLLSLFYCLLGLSAMDLEEYYVDIRLTWLALLIGLVCHAISPAQVWPSVQYVSPGWAAFAIGCTLTLSLLHWTWPMPEEQPITGQTAPPDGQAPQAQPPQAQEAPTGTAARHLVPVWLLAVIAAVLVGLEIVACQEGLAGLSSWLVIGLSLPTLFAAILAASWLPTEADEAIAEAVEAERSLAVRQVLREALILAAAVATGAGLMWLVRPQEPGSYLWASLFAWSPWEGVQPVAGLTTALFGWIIAGGLCWLIRVLFTLVLRKEALGFGDIHIIAAAGAVLGPHLALAGFFLAAPIALLGTAVLMFRKDYRTLPFGPWLSLGFLLALLWGRGLVDYIDAGLSGLLLVVRT